MQLERDRLVGLDAERTRAPAGQDQARRDRRAKRAERSEPLLVRAPRPAGRAASRCRFRPPPAGRPELSQSPADAHLLTRSEQDGTSCLRCYYLASVLTSLPWRAPNTNTEADAFIPAKPLIRVAFIGDKVLWQVKVPSSHVSRRGPPSSPADAAIGSSRRQITVRLSIPGLPSRGVSGADLPAAGAVGGPVRPAAARAGRRTRRGRPDRPVARRPRRDGNRPFALHQRAGRACPPAPAARPGRRGGDRGRHRARRQSAADRAARHRPAAGAGGHRRRGAAAVRRQAVSPTTACGGWS